METERYYIIFDLHLGNSVVEDKWFSSMEEAEIFINENSEKGYTATILKKVITYEFD